MVLTIYVCQEQTTSLPGVAAGWAATTTTPSPMMRRTGTRRTRSQVRGPREQRVPQVHYRTSLTARRVLAPKEP